MRDTQAVSGNAVPLSWAAGAARPDPYVNLGDALSPVMVALVSGRPVTRAAMAVEAERPGMAARLAGRAGQAGLGGVDRMAAVGTIGQNLRGGSVALWGTGCSPYAGPPGKGARSPYRPPAGTDLRIAAARGPYAARLLSGGGRPAVPFGDPAMLLPRFHHRPVAPRYALGVILHLAELADRAHVAHPAPRLTRYDGIAPAYDLAPRAAGIAGLVEGFRRGFGPPTGDGGEDGIALITMVTAPDAGAIAARLDTIRACRRIVSTSLHGIALALAYGIPCLYLAPPPGPAGFGEVAVDPAGIDWPEGINPRFPDLYAGLGYRRMPFWRQPKDARTDWDAVMAAIDTAIDPAEGRDACAGARAEDLIAACPAGWAGAMRDLSPGQAALDANPLIATLPFMGRPDPIDRQRPVAPAAEGMPVAKPDPGSEGLLPKAPPRASTPAMTTGAATRAGPPGASGGRP